MTINLKKVEEVCDDLHDGEDTDAHSDVGDACVHVVIGSHLVILDTYKSYQEVVPLIHLIS